MYEARGNVGNAFAYAVEPSPLVVRTASIAGKYYNEIQKYPLPSLKIKMRRPVCSLYGSTLSTSESATNDKSNGFTV